MISHRVNDDLKEINTEQIFFAQLCHSSQSTRKAARFAHFALAFHTGNLSLHFGDGLPKRQSACFCVRHCSCPLRSFC